ncbi:hypothetical protein CSV61_08930 [Sporosarcina sp. P3]|uniref:hypothetical protein n=1 Tax=Sporosarcina sp. P3 TaxID=2048245 RepID=UPI000C16AA05|nr:hypothetical protein [Sporosarcina sp. P3]PID21348.1 hypothetical protein CSV61_08930 [Sporosarcina sp. P3]
MKKDLFVVAFVLFMVGWLVMRTKIQSVEEYYSTHIDEITKDSETVALTLIGGILYFFMLYGIQTARKDLIYYVFVFLPQNPQALFMHFTVKEELFHAVSVQKMPKEQRELIVSCMRK